MVPNDLRRSELPKQVRVLQFLRRTLFWLSLVFAFIGMVASFDALQSGLRTPEHSFDTTAGTTLELNLPFTGNPNLLPSDFELVVTPHTSSLTGQNFAISKSKKSVLVTLHVLPSVLPGPYEVTLLYKQGMTTPWTINVYADKTAMHEASLSYLQSLFGVDPLHVTVFALVAFLLSLLSSFFSNRWLQRLFLRSGFLRVFHTREEGNDTLLYCIDVHRTLADDHRYPILTAKGHLLGFATVFERGRQHCILRLQASHASIGCLIGVQSQ